MEIDTRKAPWYVAGLAFECQGCGSCCAGPGEGYVWVTQDEIAAIAEYLSITPDEMHKSYLRRVSRRYSLREDQRTKDCVFLSPDQGQGRRCAIYPVRPTQCRTWPFWPANLRRPGAWVRAAMKCRGINRGRLIPFDRIEAMRNTTRE